MQVAYHYATDSIKFVLYTLATVAAVVRRILKTRVTLRNISHASCFLTGRLRIMVFTILTIAPLISESLLGNNRDTMKFQKCFLQKYLGTFS